MHNLRLTRLLFVCVALAIPACAQTIPNIDDSLSGWQYSPPCYGSSCAGGNGIATDWSLTINNASPSLDGHSMLGSFVGQSGLPSGETTNVLWPWKYGANNAITNYLGTYHVYLTNVSNIQALEYDQFGFHNAGSPGNRFMQGSECDNPSLTAGFWRIWNAKTASWVTTSVPCTIFTANTWHSIVWSTSVDPVTSTSCSGSPCMHYLGLTVDGVAQSGFPITEPSGTSSDPDNNGIQFQIDCSSAAGTCSEYIDEMSLVMSNSSYPVPVFPGVSIGSGVTIYNGTHGVSIQ